jgi:hypothetical protein
MTDILFREKIDGIINETMDGDFWAFLMARFSVAYKKKSSSKEVKGLFYSTFPNMNTDILNEICRYAFETIHPEQTYQDSIKFPNYIFGSTYYI